jgi:hypothetical protein
MIARTLFGFGALVLALLVVGCGDAKDASTPSPTSRAGEATSAPVRTPTATPQVIATATAPRNAWHTIIEAATRNDVDALAKLVRFTPTACITDVQGMGGPPDCRPGEANGTLVDVLAISDCEGHYVRRDEPAFYPVAAGTVTFVNAYNAPAGLFPPGETVLVFTRIMPGIGEIGWQLMLADDAIVGVKYGCGETASGLIERQQLGQPIAAD